jgi:hypothetical protein
MSIRGHIIGLKGLTTVFGVGTRSGPDHRTVPAIGTRQTASSSATRGIGQDCRPVGAFEFGRSWHQGLAPLAIDGRRFAVGDALG